MRELVLGDGSAQKHLHALRALPATSLVGVGVAATVLLGAATESERHNPPGMLALFPFLGVDAPPYGYIGQSTRLCDALLRFGATWLGRRLLSQVSVSAEPMGLQGVYPPGSLSWSQAAGCMVAPDFVSLIIPPAAPVTVVLNRSAPALDEAASELLVGALNPHLSLGFAAPDDDDLSVRVRDWLVQGAWRSGTGVVHA